MCVGRSHTHFVGYPFTTIDNMTIVSIIQNLNEDNTPLWRSKSCCTPCYSILYSRHSMQFHCCPYMLLLFFDAVPSSQIPIIAFQRFYPLPVTFIPSWNFQQASLSPSPATFSLIIPLYRPPPMCTSRRRSFCLRKTWFSGYSLPKTIIPHIQQSHRFSIVVPRFTSTFF